MAKDYENLTHHESLRFDFLQKNIHFLSDRDQAEYDYLAAKIAGKVPFGQNPNPPKRELRRRPLPNPTKSPDQVTPEGLPVFQSGSKSYRPLTQVNDSKPISKPEPLRSSRPTPPPVTERIPVPTLVNRQPTLGQTPGTQELLRPAPQARVLPQQAKEPIKPVSQSEAPSSQAVPQFNSRKSKKQTKKPLPKVAPSEIVAGVRADKAKRQQARKKARKRKPGMVKRVLLAAGLLFLVTLFGMFLLFLKGYYDVKQDDKTAEAAEVQFFDGQDTRDGINILVLGTDSRVGQTMAESRTDSIMVVNIGNSDGKIKMVSFMRDTLINIPEVSYEDGINTYYDQKLNTAFSIGEQNDRQGAEAIRIALKAHFDIDIKYYAMIDFVTFATAIDTLFPKGVKIDARFATVEGEAVDSVQVPDDLNAANGVVPEQTIEIGEQYMDGRTLLNYARFRKDDSGDFGRTERQQQVLTAILQQVKNPTKLFTGSAALGKIMGMTSTNIPYSFMLSKGLSVISDAGNGIDQVTIPEQGDWVDEYDMYGGLGLSIDFDSYQARLEDLGLR